MYDLKEKIKEGRSYFIFGENTMAALFWVKMMRDTHKDSCKIDLFQNIVQKQFSGWITQELQSGIRGEIDPSLLFLRHDAHVGLVLMKLCKSHCALKRANLKVSTHSRFFPAESDSIG